MRRFNQWFCLSIVFTTIGMSLVASDPARAASGADISRNAQSALQKLYARSPEARALAQRARAILVFPSIVKGGFIFGLQYGEGALMMNRRIAGYYSTVSASYGFQAGVQSFGYALFLMNDSALAYLNTSGGWELGVGPSIVLVDEGMARSLTTTTARKDIYAFFFDQQGLMAGAGLQGTKISRINP